MTTSVAMTSYSVLMSIYKKENPSFLRQALDSMLAQTVPPTEIVMVKDGPLTTEHFPNITRSGPICSNLSATVRTMD